MKIPLAPSSLFEREQGGLRLKGDCPIFYDLLVTQIIVILQEQELQQGTVTIFSNSMTLLMKLIAKTLFIRLWIAVLLVGMVMVACSPGPSPDPVPQPPLKIGDNYGGGTIFYLLQPGDPGYVAGQQHGLIAATEDMATTYTDAYGGGPVTGFYRWSTGQNSTLNNTDYFGQLTDTSTDLGQGAANTVKILQKYPPDTYPNTAAAVANAYRGGGYGDWYLPSKDELNKLCLNKSAVGVFAERLFFWSSSESVAENAWDQTFSDGHQDVFMKTNANLVRPVRSF